MKSVIPIVFGLLVCLCAVDAASQEECDWGAVRFEPMLGTPASYVVDAVVNRDPHSEYSRYFAEGNHWACIVDILSRIIEGETMGERLREALGSPQDPLMTKITLYHSGHRWGFWYRVAKLGMAASELGDLKVLAPEFRRVVEQMKEAFLPQLDPEFDLFEVPSE